MSNRRRLREIQLKAVKQLHVREEQAKEEAQHQDGVRQFGARGFSNRVNISLNSLIPQSESTCTFELRTLTEVPLSAMLPDPVAVKLLQGAMKPTLARDMCLLTC
jgi:hypothetical protein